MSQVQDERPSFCKLILQKEPVQHLTIPPDFSRLYHCELPDTVILKGPSGNNWPAKLHKSPDFIYVQDDGWQNFHRDKALGNGEFLVFQYDRKDYFKVQVFDPTGVERLYVASAESTGTSNLRGHRSRGRPRKHPVGYRNFSVSKSPNSQGDRLPLPTHGKNIENAGRKIPGFYKVYRPEHSSMRMKIPKAYLRWLDWPSSEEIILKRPSGRQWHVKVIFEEQDAYFEDGWQEFVRDNLVETNDFMVFSRQGQGLYIVVLYGHSACEKKESAVPEEAGEGSEVPEHNRDHDNDHEEEEEPEGSRKRSKGKEKVEDPIDVEQYIDTKNPYFVTTVRSFRSPYLRVPAAVLNDYELQLPQTIEFQVPNGRMWRGLVKVWTDHRTWISGWGALCRHYNLKLQDQCICELLEKEGVTGRIIKVHIMRG